MFYSKIAVISALVAMVLGAPAVSNSSGVIKVPLQKVKGTGKQGNLTTVAKRSLPSESLDFSGFRYYATYTIGGQEQTAILDTGSSDTWTFSNKAWSGGYDPSKSSTYHWLNDDLVESYGTGNDNVYGTWGTDTVGLGGAEVPNYPIGFLNQTDPIFSDNRGIFAIGPKSSESLTPEYPTYAERLKDAGVIQSNSFSLFSDASNSEATLLLGGIDTARYNGPLYTLPFDTTELYKSAYYTVDFEFQGTTYSGGVLDTGTANVLLPQDVADSVASEYGAQWVPSFGGYISFSAPADNLPPLDFQIGGVTISIPGDEVYTYDDGLWVFAISRNINEILFELNILGDPILRQAYLFFDIDKNELAFAPIKQTSESNLVAVGGSIPGSQPAPDQTEGNPNGGFF